MTRDRAANIMLGLLLVGMVVVGVVTFLNLANQAAINHRIVALADAHHANSDAIARAQQQEIVHVDQLADAAAKRACRRSNQTRSGLRIFFADSVTRSVARAHIDKGAIRRLDLEGARSSQRSVRAERADRC